MFLLSNCTRMFVCLLVLSYTPGILLFVAAAIVLSHDCACVDFNCVGIRSQPCVMYHKQGAFSFFFLSFATPYLFLVLSFHKSIGTVPTCVILNDSKYNLENHNASSFRTDLSFTYNSFKPLISGSPGTNLFHGLSIVY